MRVLWVSAQLSTGVCIVLFLMLALLRTQPPEMQRLSYTTDANGNNDIYVKWLDSSQENEQFTFSPFFEENAIWHPDGAFINFESSADAVPGILTAPAHGFRPVVSLEIVGFESVEDVAWSSDGTWLVFSGRRAAQWDLYRGNFSGDAIRDILPLTSDAARERDAVIAPDNRTVVYASNLERGYKLYQVPASGGDIEQLTFPPGNHSAPAFSPDGNTMLFVNSIQYDLFGNAALATLNMNSLAIEIMQAEDGTVIGGDNPDWSSKGDLVIFERYGGPTSSDVYLMDMETDTVWGYLTTTEHETEPRFAPIVNHRLLNDASLAIIVIAFVSGWLAPVLPLKLYHQVLKRSLPQIM